MTKSYSYRYSVGSVPVVSVSSSMYLDVSAFGVSTRLSVFTSCHER